MSTIIKRLGQAALALAGWAAIMLAMPFFGPEGRDVAVIGEVHAAVRAVVNSGGRVIGIRNGVVVARADPAALYRAGAGLVLEGRLAAGCGAAASAGE